jgi:hypothetical protein
MIRAAARKGGGAEGWLRRRVVRVSGRLIDYIAGHACGEGQPLSEHRIALRPLPLTLAEVVGVLHVAKGGITVATTVLLFPTSPVT